MAQKKRFTTSGFLKLAEYARSHGYWFCLLQNTDHSIWHLVGHFRTQTWLSRAGIWTDQPLKVKMAGEGEGEGGRGCWGGEGGGGCWGGRGKGFLAFLKNLWVERGALSEVKAFFLRTGEWRVESGEWNKFTSALQAASLTCKPT